MRLCRIELMVIRDKTEINSLAFSPDGGFTGAVGQLLPGVPAASVV
jgi:hypothetical protein